jgi:hypothetical protein
MKWVRCGADHLFVVPIEEPIPPTGYEKPKPSRGMNGIDRVTMRGVRSARM